jgi:hypothetical protein
MAKTGFTWEVTPEQAFADLYDNYTRQIYREIQRLAKKYAAEIEAYLKANAIWTDRTGNLRQSMYAEVESSLTAIVLAFDYGLEYGVFLEFANQGEYQIIAPALDHFAPKFWADVQALFR